MKRLLILSVTIFLFSVTVFSQKNNISITAKDRTEIAAIILSKFDFVNRQLNKTEKRGEVYLLNENVSGKRLPKASGIKFILLTRQEIQERVKNGFGYFAFQSFQIENLNILVAFSYNYEDSGYHRRNPLSGGSPDFTKGTRYEFQKVKGIWQGKEINGFMRGS